MSYASNSPPLSASSTPNPTASTSRARARPSPRAHAHSRPRRPPCPSTMHFLHFPSLTIRSLHAQTTSSAYRRCKAHLPRRRIRPPGRSPARTIWTGHLRTPSSPRLPLHLRSSSDAQMRTTGGCVRSASSHRRSRRDSKGCSRARIFRTSRCRCSLPKRPRTCQHTSGSGAHFTPCPSRLLSQAPSTQWSGRSRGTCSGALK